MVSWLVFRTTRLEAVLSLGALVETTLVDKELRVACFPEGEERKGKFSFLVLHFPALLPLLLDLVPAPVFLLCTPRASF